MALNRFNSFSHLDKIRIQYGMQKLKNSFLKLGEENSEYAVTLINDKRLFFISLFILLPEIEVLNLYKRLSARNIEAIKVCSKILKDDKTANNVDFLPSENDPHNALQWMFVSGANYDGLSREYDKIMDGTASLLINIYKDNTILPIILNMIFNRNRKGAFIHDLVWVLFQAHDLNILKSIANFLSSSNKKDVDLVCKLLNFEFTEENLNSEKKKQYRDYLLWVKENSPYIFFTDESFQQTSNPQPLSVDLGAKYLCKEVFANSDQLSENECGCLNCFNELNDDEKDVLLKYSQKMHYRNTRKWNEWISRPVDEQISIAKKNLGVMI